MRRPYKPTFADVQRIDANDYHYASTECVCEDCKCAYWKHRTVEGYTWLTRLCNGKFVKL